MCTALCDPKSPSLGTDAPSSIPPASFRADPRAPRCSARHQWGPHRGGISPRGASPSAPRPTLAAGGFGKQPPPFVPILPLPPHPFPSLPLPAPGGARGSSAGAEGRSGPAGGRWRRCRDAEPRSAPRGAARHGSAPGAMPLPCRGWTLALLTLLVGFLIFADISEIEEEEGSG